MEDEAQRRLPGRASPVNSILDAVGSTPLVRLERYLPGRDVELWLKLEGVNPGGSVKDRPALEMLRDAVARGRLAEGGTVIESSSGNMGVGLAQACRYLGLRFICVVDTRAAAEKVATMRAFGAEVEVVREPDPATGDLLAARIARVAGLCAEIPGAFWPDQYENPANPRAHAVGTMREIDEALAGRVDCVLVPASTTGTLAGCQQYLRERGSDAEVIGVDAVGSALFGGERAYRRLPGLGAGLETGISRRAAPVRIERMSELECVIGCRRLIDREAIFAGASSGGALAAATRLAPELRPGASVAVIAPDGGAGYLRTVYDDRWVESELGVDPARVHELVAAGREIAEASTPA